MLMTFQLITFFLGIYAEEIKRKTLMAAIFRTLTFEVI